MKSLVSICMSASILFGANQAFAAWEEASIPPLQPQQQEQLVPGNLELSFSGPVDISKSRAVLINAAGKTVPTDKPFLDRPEGSVIKIPLDPSIAPGLYTLNWHVRSLDGQNAEGSYQFRVDP